jgi:hypothetical protein
MSNQLPIPAADQFGDITNLVNHVAGIRKMVAAH